MAKADTMQHPFSMRAWQTCPPAALGLGQAVSLLHTLEIFLHSRSSHRVFHLQVIPVLALSKAGLQSSEHARQ